MSRHSRPPVCKFFVQGRCLAGDRCRYAHPAPAASRVELNQIGGRNASQQSGGRRLLVPPPLPAASGQQNGSATSSSSSTRQRLGSAAPGCATETDSQPDATATAPQRPAWGAKPASALAGQHAHQQQPVKAVSLAYNAANFVPASPAWKADSGQQQGGDAAGEFAEAEHEDWPYGSGYGHHEEEQQGYSYHPEQDWYQPHNGDGGHNSEWDPQAEQGQWQHEGSFGADEEEALQQQLNGLQVDEPTGGGEPSEWLLMCEVCGKFVLDPEDDEQCAEHLAQCSARHERVAARHASANIECGICLELVMGQQPPSARKFGLLACEHAFCLRCIRSWRGTGDSDATTETARTCPLCRARSHFVTPSAVWPTSQQQKDDIISGYKHRLASIDCRNFKLGKGNCPFGTSCFYRHAYPDGTLWQPSLRKVGDAEGEIRVVAPVRLSSFLETSPALQR